MSDVFKTFAVRNPAALSGVQTATFGIHSHPSNYQSKRYLEWQGLCVANDSDALEAAVSGFLNSTESIKSLDDLDEGWRTIITSFLWHGAKIDNATAIDILEQNRTTSLFGKDGRIAGTVRTAVADTILALARMKRLSERRSMDIQAVLRVVTFTERAVAQKLIRPSLDTASHFAKPILLPHQFFALDRCRDLKPAPRPVSADDHAMAAGEGKRSLAKSDPCNCEPDIECVNQSPCCATVIPYVVDLMVVRDYTKCFQPGDLSFVRNVLAGESLSNRHRRLDRTEEIGTTEEETNKYSERDLQIEDRSALKSEVEDTVKSDLDLDAGVTGNASWGNEKVGVKYDAHVYADVSSSLSKESLKKETREYARNVIDRSISKLEAKVKTSLKTTRLVETEETNKHRFVNNTDANISGQYLYVNKVSRAQVYNYGKKAVVDIHLPEPAELYIRLLENKFTGVEPPAPRTISVTAAEITPDNYGALVAQYGLTDVASPPAYITQVLVTLEGESPDPKGKEKSGSHTFSFPCVIPTDYVGVSMSVHNVRLNYNSGGGVSISATLGPNGDSVWHQDGNTHHFVQSLPSIEGSQTVIVHTWDVTNFTWVLTIACELKESVKAAWRGEVFSAIQMAYAKEVADYQKYLDEKAAFDEKEAERKRERYNQNPFLLREIERRELKRMVISYISCQFYDQFNAMKARVKPCGHPQMDLREAEKEGRFVQFFEQAFNWNLMTYIFYGYFWGRKYTWREKLEEESSDPIFKQFLAAGSARVLVPIRDGYFDHMQWFLSTGEIWGNSGKPPLPDDPHYVSLAQEIKEQKDNYYADRLGRIDVVSGSTQVKLQNTPDYWNLGDASLDPPIPPHFDTLAIEADIDREIVIDCKVYRIVAIEANPPGAAPPVYWTISLDRPYEGETADKLPWSTGALFVGAPWEFVTPTTLTFLRDKSVCLPCYPLKECKEPE